MNTSKSFTKYREKDNCEGEFIITLDGLEDPNIELTIFAECPDCGYLNYISTDAISDIAID